MTNDALTYEPAEIAAAKDIAHVTLDERLTHDGEIDVIEAADTIVERLLEQGVIIPQTVTSPFRIGENK